MASERKVQPVILRQLTGHVKAHQTVAKQQQQQQSIDLQQQWNDAQRRLIERLQQQVSTQDHEVKQLQQQVSTQDEEVKQLQQQLAAARDQAGEAVELRVRALERQVKQLLLALQDRQ